MIRVLQVVGGLNYGGIDFEKFKYDITVLAQELTSYYEEQLNK